MLFNANRNAYLVMWDAETTNFRNFRASGILKRPNNIPNINKILIWLDNCYGQNKNVS